MNSPRPSVLVAMNGFKGSLTNVQATEAVATALSELGFPTQSLPVGDGGMGTKASVKCALKGESVSFEVSGPRARKVQAEILCLPNTKSPRALFIESADTCGLPLFTAQERDAMRSSSLGLGELILAGMQRWGETVEKVYIGLGDSGTSDMGMGMLHSLGFGFIDEGGKPLWGNADGLRHIRTIKSPTHSFLETTKFVILCDVLNPLCGPAGSARVYGRQKGATPGEISLIERGMEHFAGMIRQMRGRSLRDEPMTGAAGGLAAAFLGFFNADLVQGAPFLLDWLNFDRNLEAHQILVTGEGRTDSQTMSGKAPWECLTRAEQLHKKSAVISGELGEGYEPIARLSHVEGCFACGDKPNAHEALFRATQEAFSNAAFLQAIAS